MKPGRQRTLPSIPEPPERESVFLVRAQDSSYPQPGGAQRAGDRGTRRDGPRLPGAPSAGGVGILVLVPRLCPPITWSPCSAGTCHGCVSPAHGGASPHGCGPRGSGVSRSPASLVRVFRGRWPSPRTPGSDASVPASPPASSYLAIPRP